MGTLKTIIALLALAAFTLILLYTLLLAVESMSPPHPQPHGAQAARAASTAPYENNTDGNLTAKLTKSTCELYNRVKNNLKILPEQYRQQIEQLYKFCNQTSTAEPNR